MSTWNVIVPIKPWHLAKQRLQVPARQRERLAQAFAADTLAALVAVSSVRTVVIVSAEPTMRVFARSFGAEVIGDHPTMPGNRLSIAIAAGRQWALSRFPHEPLAVVPADLAGATPEALEQALAALGRYQRAFVPDHEGSGSTLVAARAPRLFAEAYGPDSAAAHVRLGLEPVLDVDACLRHDIDTAADLERAAVRGLGSATTALVAPGLLGGRTMMH